MQRKALLALDDPVRAARLEGLLAGANFQLRSCLTVANAIRALSSESLSVAFCQERLPDGTYRDILHALGPSGVTPVVVCAEFYDERAYLEAMSLGAFDYIAFPYQRKEVEWIVANCERRAARPSRVGGREHPAAA